MNNIDLVEKAKGLVNPKNLSGETVSGEVGSALVIAKGNVYTGVSIHASCGIGFCAEHTAIGSMLTDGETNIKKIVAVGEEGVLPPCGRCRELMYQVDLTNADTDIILGENKVAKLKDLLPEYWQ
ncbi:cytidine deaminase [bacterium]|nr:cytidine deaminase [bacterium]|tara:strand:+ start:568 stop:942 length:375 start_codon:yes stop_codon:yes gene_type:complete